MKPKFKAIIFDFDGTLVNTEYFHYQCTQDLLQSTYGKNMTIEYYNEKLLGRPTSSSVNDVISDFELSVAPKELLKMIEHHTGNRLMQHDVELMPYAVETIDYFQSQNLPLSIVTGSQYRSVSFILSQKNLRSHFTEIVTFDDVKHSKPHPEPYNTCIHRLGYDKSEVLALEDTENGVKSAKAAGLTCYAIQSEKNLHKRLSEADKLFDHMGDVVDHLRQKK